MPLQSSSLIRFLLGALFCIFALSAQRRSMPGDFDHYRLTLSWSPEYCYDHRGSPECSGAHHYGFIVHGLWPEFRNGGAPEFCGQDSARLPEFPELFALMPDRHLIVHEWRAHGSCTGLSPNEYFGLVVRASHELHIPDRLRAPPVPLTTSPSLVKRAFEQENRALDPSALSVECRRGYLTAIEICLDKQLHPLACASPRDCNARTIRIAPVR